MVSYCSLSNDQSLTKILIENSNKSSSKCFHRFFNTSEWIDGLDIWTTELNIKKNEISRRNLDFDQDIGLYLPRQERSTKNDLNYSKGINKDFVPHRLRQLINREEKNSSLDQQFEDNQTTNIIQKQNCNESSSNKVRFPIRQIERSKTFDENKTKPNNQSINQDKFQSLLKEELSNLFRRETTNISSKRTLIRIPSVQIKHHNVSTKPLIQTDSTSILERYAKLQQLLISPTPSQTTINKKLIDYRQSPIIFQGISTFGLTVTPLDFSQSKHLQNSSNDKIIEQETTCRPVTQPVHQNEEQQTISSKRNIKTGIVPSNDHFVLSNKSLTDEQTQSIRKCYRYHRSSSRTTIQRVKTLQFLPHIAGKRIDISISNQTNSQI